LTFVSFSVVAQRAANPETEYVFTRAGDRIRDFRKALSTAIEKAGLVAGRKGHTFHGARRSAITNHAEAGIAEDVSMLITGHKDRAVHRRYRQLREANVLAAAKVMNDYFAGTTGQVSGQVENAPKARVRK
jgi:integrase